MIEKIQADLKSAMLARDTQTVSTLKLVKSALQNKRIEVGQDLDDKEIMAVLRSEAKKRKESIEMYKSADKTDLAEKEEAELKIIESYLPQQMTDEELVKLVEEVKTEVGEDAHMGQLIQATIAKAEGRVDGRRVSEYIKELNQG